MGILLQCIMTLVHICNIIRWIFVRYCVVFCLFVGGGGGLQAQVTFACWTLSFFYLVLKLDVNSIMLKSCTIHQEVSVVTISCTMTCDFTQSHSPAFDLSVHCPCKGNTHFLTFLLIF